MREMKLRYKFIYFEKSTGYVGGRLCWACKNKKTGGLLGWVVWYPPWKIWCLGPADSNGGIIFSADCLRDTADFMEQLKP